MKVKDYSRKKKIQLLLVILWMIIIFSYSAKDNSASTADSHFIGYRIGELVIKDFDSLPAAEQEAFAEKIDHPIRKTAHGMEYAILCFLVTAYFNSLYMEGGRFYLYQQSAKLKWILPVLISFLYACSDEIHQSFVPGRACRFTDVLIDSGGAFAGLLFYALIHHIHLSKRKS